MSGVPIVASFGADAIESLEMAFFMLWETLWALILGFTLSGAVQAFVSHEDMERTMGDHGPASVTRAGLFGMVSSSCSYAATAMAKSLFQKGADFITAMIFMFASTNLVIELGVVLFILMGWQFAAAEFIGGPIMIILVAVFGGFVLRRTLTEPARERLVSGHVGTHDHQAMVGVTEERQHELERTPWRDKLSSKAAWSDAASYTMADITMLRRELVIGYVVAGVITVFVSHEIWETLFFEGHGFWTSLENAFLGPFVAVVSFVCSIGNVPLAAALWHGGLGFGGVIAFIYADLITFPLLLIYRKYYGTALTLRLLAVFWVVMAAAGLLVEGLFEVVNWIPEAAHGEVVHTRFAWNYTTVLNIVFLTGFAFLYWLYRNRERFGGGQGYAIDPVCGMQVRTAHAPASTYHGGHRVWFCSDRCRERFEANPERFSGPDARPEGMEPKGVENAAPESVTLGRKPVAHVDPVCGMTVDPATAAAHRVHEGRDVWFCGEGCAASFDADPDREAHPAAHPGHSH